MGMICYTKKQKLHHESQQNIRTIKAEPTSISTFHHLYSGAIPKNPNNLWNPDSSSYDGSYRSHNTPFNENNSHSLNANSFHQFQHSVQNNNNPSKNSYENSYPNSYSNSYSNSNNCKDIERQQYD